MKIGKLDFEPLAGKTDLAARPVLDLIAKTNLEPVLACVIDANLSDTVAFCEHYAVGLDISANCVVVEARRAERTWYAACVILATDRADINNIVRRQLDARKISFASMDKAVELTSMEYGGINPIGLPVDWTIFVDESVAANDWNIIGSGVRGSKLLVPGKLLANLPGAVVMKISRDLNGK